MSSPASTEWRETPFRLDACPDLRPLRQALDDAGYTESFVSKTVLKDDTGKPMDMPVLLAHTAEPTAFNTLVRLFVLARTVPEAAAQTALAAIGVEPLTRLGLLKRAEGGIRAEAALLLHDDLYFARDFWPDFVGHAVRPDFVPGPAPATEAVANMTVRRQGERALDLGIGSGFLALTAARHVKSIVGTDISARALNFAAFNARLNGVESLELRPGSLYEPVAGERFDLIMCNPPFVISPRARFEYRDSGMSGDSISEQVIRHAHEHLNEGGFATVLFNWHHQQDDDWVQRPRQWIAEGGCDAWLIHSKSDDPVTYAATWLPSEVGPDRKALAPRLNEWLSYFDESGISRISLGAIILRRRTGKNWFRSEDQPPGDPNGSCSEQIQRIFAAQDFLESLGDERRLLDVSLALTPDHQMQQTLHAADGKWRVAGAQLKQTRGFPYIGNVDRLVGSLVVDCNGQRPLGELIAELARELNLSTEQITPSCLAMARKLLETGFLVVA